MGASISSSSDRFLSSFSHGVFVPTATDVQHVFFLLNEKLPPELAIAIIEQAEYWTMDSLVSPRHVVVRSGQMGDLASSALILSSPLRRGPTTNAVRRITFTAESKDQGFSSFPQYYNTREHSSSWFEAALVRPQDNPGRTATYTVIFKETLYYNVHAAREYNSATHQLEVGNALVDHATANDRIVIYACAQYPMWTNEVRSCKLTIESAAV